MGDERHRARPFDVPRWPDQRGSIWTGLVVVLALIAAVCVVLVLIAGSRQGTVRRGWQQSLGTPEAVFACYPSREVNAAALELERLAAALEIDVVPRHRRTTQRHRLSPGSPTRTRTQELGAWVGDTLTDARLRIVEPPLSNVEFLDAHAATLDAVRRLLIDGERPAWKRRLEDLWSAPIPNLLGLLELQRALIADALLHVQRGDDATALGDLEASWRLAEVLLDEPEQIVNLIGIAMARQVAGALRHVESAPVEWSARLDELEVREPVIRSMMLSAWVWSQVDGAQMNEAQDGLLVRTLRSMTGPYMSMSMGDLSERMRICLERFKEVDPRCDADLDALGVGFELKIPRWNAARAYYGPGMFSGVIERANRLDLDLDLTARLIELRAARAANDGRWPRSLPIPPGSRACPGDRWSYRVEHDGTLRFGLERAPNWRELPPSNHGVLPTSVVVR